MSTWLVMSAVVTYFSALLLVALWVDRRRSPSARPWVRGVVYTLSLAIYCTSWTYYGSVGMAVSSGTLFLAVYVGPVAGAFLWWSLLRRLVRLRERYRVTSIADAIAARYHSSGSVATLVTVMAMVGVVPYIALQQKSILSALALLTEDAIHAQGPWAGLVLVVALTVFTILFGLRRLDQTERHGGLVAVVCVESVVKLAALLVLGAWLVFGVMGGPAELARKAAELEGGFTGVAGEGHTFVAFVSFSLLGLVAVLLLPRQFHVAVVEQGDDRSIRMAQWLFPLYLLAITVVVVPIALSGRLLGLPTELADTYVLRIPLALGSDGLSLLVFLGGMSAAMSMILVSTVTIATMAANHVVLPVLQRIPRLQGGTRHLLQARWGVALLLLLVAWGFERTVGETYMLVSMGLLSFVAVLQFAPPLLGGLLWQGANRRGALAGLGAGFGVWIYTLLLPSFARSGWLPVSFVEEGPLGFFLLRPEALLGIGGLDRMSHAVLWTLLVNVGALVVVSRLTTTSEGEERRARDVVHILDEPELDSAHLGDTQDISLPAKQGVLHQVARDYLSDQAATRLVGEAVAAARIEGSEISVLQLADLRREAERLLAGSIGVAAAHRAIRGSDLIDEEERLRLSVAYAGLLADLEISPAELRRRIDYHREREGLLRQHAEELGERVQQRTAELVEANSRLREEMAERERLETRLQLAQKLEAIGQLAAGVAHEINTPMQYIGDNLRFIQEAVGDLSELVEGYRAALRAPGGQPVPSELEALALVEEEIDLESLPEDLRTAFDGSIQGVQHVARIVRALREFGHPGGRERVPVDLNEVIERVLVVARNEYKHVAELHTELGLLPVIEGSPQELGQVFLNLVINAAHAMEEGAPGGGLGQLRVVTSAVEGGVEVQVEDTGCGIPADLQSRVFDPFFTTKQVGKGSGQGLAIVHDIVVNKHGGRVVVESEVGRGTTFRVVLPLDREAS